MNPVVALLGVALVLTAPAAAADPGPGRSAVELENAIARIRAKVEAQRAETGSAARDAAARSTELDRLAAHLAALERDNLDLHARNDELARELEEAGRRSDRLERENEALAKLAAARLDALPAAAERLAAARGEIEAIAMLLDGLTAARLVPRVPAQDQPLQRLEAPGAGGELEVPDR